MRVQGGSLGTSAPARYLCSAANPRPLNAGKPPPAPKPLRPRPPTWNSGGAALTNRSMSMVLPHPTPPYMYSPCTAGAGRPGCGARPEELCSSVDRPVSLLGGAGDQHG
jgi:hypothetical protein